MDGEIVREEELDDYVFGAPVNMAVLHQVVTSQFVNRRQGNASTKTRAHVSGGNKKPFRQKGTGRARQGSTRAPQWRGGGSVFGPRPHSYDRAIPRKMKRLALRSALSDKAANNAIILMDELTFEQPRTRDMEDLLARLPIERNVLLLMPERDENVILSARNIHRVKLGNVASTQCGRVAEVRSPADASGDGRTHRRDVWGRRRRRAANEASPEGGLRRQARRADAGRQAGAHRGSPRARGARRDRQGREREEHRGQNNGNHRDYPARRHHREERRASADHLRGGTGRIVPRYTFKVALEANKFQIRLAVEQMFGVKVVKVNTMRMPGKRHTVRTRKGLNQSEARPWKKAIVTLAEGQSIPDLQA